METKNAAERFAALGHESRLSILRWLVEVGPDGDNAGAIGERLGMVPATLSFHLAHLSRVGLVRSQRESRFIRYFADFAAVDALIAFLTNNCCQGRPCLPSIQEKEKAMTAPKTVLVLCTGNSCRSQMAEALINHVLAGRVRALSAGTRPQPLVAAGALEALRLGDLPTDGLHPKDVAAVLNEPIDLLITVCDNAKETCPIFPRPVPHIHLPFHDPHGEPLQSFIEVRDDIRTRLIPAVRAALNL